ncbi:MAG: DUF4384 domain-containing protein [Planctomycetota bacterium]
MNMLICAIAAAVLSGCASESVKMEASPEETVAPSQEADPLASPPKTDGCSLETAMEMFLSQVKAAKSEHKLFPNVWGVTPVVRKISTSVPFEDARTLRITGMVEEALLSIQPSSHVAFSLVEMKEMERLLGNQRKQFTDLYQDDDIVAVGELVRAQAFLFGTLTGTQGENLSLSLIDATTRYKYAQVSAVLPPDTTPPPPPLSLTVTLRAEPVEGQVESTPSRDLYEGSAVYSGEGMVIYANLSESAYLYVFVRFSQGEVIPVFPAIEGSAFYAPLAPQNPLPAGREISIPSSEFSYAWDDHTGKELVLFVASRTPLMDLDSCVKKLVDGANMSTSKTVWEETLATSYLTRGLSGAVKKQQAGNGPSSAIVFKSQGQFVGGSILLNHE